jgi:hypothetical protein
MKVKDIEIGKYYKFKEHPDYSYAKVLQVLKPKEDINTNNYIVIKCEHVINKNDSFGFIRYFKPTDLIKE